MRTTAHSVKTVAFVLPIFLLSSFNVNAADAIPKQPRSVNPVVQAPPAVSTPDVKTPAPAKPAPDPTPAVVKPPVHKPAPGPTPPVVKPPVHKPAPGPTPPVVKPPVHKPAPGPTPPVVKPPVHKPAPGPQTSVVKPPVHKPAPGPQTSVVKPPVQLPDPDVEPDNTPQPVNVPGSLRDTSQKLQPDEHSQRVRGIYGKTPIIVPQPESPEIIGESDKPVTPRTLDGKPAGSVTPKLDAEAASQANPIRQQSWKSRENIKLRQERNIQTASIPDKTKRGWLAALQEMPVDESHQTGKLDIVSLILQGTAHDIEVDPGINNLPDNLTEDRSKIQELNDKLTQLENTGDSGEELEGQGRYGGRVRSPGTYTGDRGPPSRPGGLPDTSAQAFATIEKERGKGGNPSSSDPSIGGTDTEDKWEDNTGSTDGADEDFDAIDLSDEIYEYRRDEYFQNIDTPKEYTQVGAYVAAILIVSLADEIFSPTAGEYVADGFKIIFGSLGWDSMPNPDGDPEDPGRGDGQAALDEWNARRDWVTQPAGEAARVYGEVDPNAPQERAKKRRDWAIVPNPDEDEGESDAGASGRKLDPRDTLPDPVEAPTLQTGSGIENQ